MRRTSSSINRVARRGTQLAKDESAMIDRRRVAVAGQTWFCLSPVTYHLSLVKISCHKINVGGVLRVEAGG
jgi:hypothetical protein